jgi:predicted TIM-barrel fold metal-dependent hydrolase
VGQQTIMRSVAKGRTWVKLSAAYRLESMDVAEACARELVKNCGPERLLWGSDWPFAAFEGKVTYADTIAAFKRCVPDDAARRIVGGETAFKLYFT